MGLYIDPEKMLRLNKNPFLKPISTHIADQTHKSFQLFKVLISLKYWFLPAVDKGKYE